MTQTELNTLVTMRLLTFGYTVKTADEQLLSYLIGKTTEYVCNFCNFRNNPEDIPEALKYIVADMAAGEFLQQKKTFAPNDLTGLNLDAAVKQVTTGDTTTVFGTGEGSQTDEQRLDAFIRYLLSYGKHELYNHRKVKW